MTARNRNTIISPAEGLIIYNKAISEINQRQNGLRMFLRNIDYWVGGGSGWMFFIADNIGINTKGPAVRPDVNGGVIALNSVKKSIAPSLTII